MTAIRDLGDGLILRRGTAADVDRLPAFNARVHNNSDTPDDPVAVWTRDLLARPHPTFRPEDFTIVEEAGSGRIVSSLNLISQTWTYAGIPFGVGRVELVGTDPDYRRRGLIRAQFDAVHAWSAERGELVQGITGIPWYYRQFGYEYALTLDGGRGGSPTYLPTDAADDASQPYGLREATLDDVPFLMATEREANRRFLVAASRDEALWRYELAGRSKMPLERLMLVETAAGEPAGFVGLRAMVAEGTITVRPWELAPGVPWPAAAPAVLRELRRVGDELSALPGAPGFRGFNLLLEDAHPAYEVLRGRLPREVEPYAWYLRVPDLPALLRRIAPALDARLAASPAAGYSGELRLCFFRDGLLLRWTDGRLTTAEHWPHPVYAESDASSPDLTFLKLLFGYRSLDELTAAFPDCQVRSDDAGLLLRSLFPRQSSNVRPID